MALTGRAALAALIGALVVLAFRTGAVLLAVNGLLLAAIAADLVLAGSVRPLRMTRSGDTRVLLGENATITLTVENPGRRPLRAIVRDSWQPSAHARPAQVRLRIPARGRATLSTALTPDRRGEKLPRRGNRALPRPLRARRQAGQARRAVGGSRASAVPQPQTPAGETLPAAAARRPAPFTPAWPGHRVRLAPRVRHRRRRPVHRLARRSQVGRCDGAHLATGAGPADPRGPRHRQDFRWPGRRRSAAGRLHGRNAAARGARVASRGPD